MPKNDDQKIFEYPLLSGKKLGDAKREDLLAEAKLDREMEAIGEEMGSLTLDQFFDVSPDKTMRLVAYTAQRAFLAGRRARAGIDPEPEFDLVVAKRIPRSASLQRSGRDLNG